MIKRLNKINKEMTLAEQLEMLKAQFKEVYGYNPIGDKKCKSKN